MAQGTKHTLSCIVSNHPGVLSRIAGSFAEQGVNIRSLAVGELQDQSASRMTIVVKAARNILTDVVDHLRNLPDVIDVDDLETEGLIERELMLIKVKAEGEDISRIMQLVEIFRATVVGMGSNTLTIEMTGPEIKADALVNLLRPLGIVEMARTGRVAIEHREEANVA